MRLGVALLEGPNAMAHIFEPIIYLTLCRWLRDSPGFSPHGIVRKCMKDAENDFNDFDNLEAIAHCFLQATTLQIDDAVWRPFFKELQPRDAVLSDYLKFSGPPPPWSEDMVSLVLPRIRGKEANFVPFTVDSTTSLVRIARSPDDVFDWFADAATPFLIPDEQFGASMLCFVQLAQAKLPVLVCFHLPPARSLRRDFRYAPRQPGVFYRKASARVLGPSVSAAHFVQIPEAAKRLRAILSALPELLIANGARETRPARFNMLRVLCFADAYTDDLHDPPLASLDFARILEKPSPPYVDFDSVVARI